MHVALYVTTFSCSRAQQLVILLLRTFQVVSYSVKDILPYLVNILVIKATRVKEIGMLERILAVNLYKNRNQPFYNYVFIRNAQV